MEQFVCQRRGCGLPIHCERDAIHKPGLYHFVAIRDDTRRIHMVFRKRGRRGCPEPATTAP